MATGRNRTTGKLTLAVGIRRRRNGLVHFDADLFKLGHNLSQDAIRWLYRYWHDLNAAHALPKQVMRKLDCPRFSKTFIEFDTALEQVSDWREFLRGILADPRSYVAIRFSAAMG